jgi:hypothetical protein
MTTILSKQQALTHHPVYAGLTNIENIRHFMHYHVFAVWDFMSLLKSLQQKLTCVSLPWRPSPYPTEVVRLINQIVLGEESDLDPEGNPVSHFELYLKGMEEVGAKTSLIRRFLKTNDLNLVPTGAREFVQFNLDVAQHGHVVEVASSFFFGREKLIPEMFEVIVETLRREKIHAPTFLYYLERHIEVDSGEHGPLALKALSHLIADSRELKELSVSSGLAALEAREKLWDYVWTSFPILPDRKGDEALAPCRDFIAQLD